MATMARPLAPLLLLLSSVLVSGAAAARKVAGDPVQDACSKTQFPELCADSLTAKPDCRTATPRKLAELYVNIVGEAGTSMASFVHGKLGGVKEKDDAMFKCFDSCSDDVEEAVAHLSALTREATDAKFLEVKSWLSSTLGGASACEDACKDAPKSADKDEVVSRSLEFEKQLRVTLDLITEASGSMSAADVALPPSSGGAADAPGGSPAYGASAGAPFGAPSPSSGGEGSSSEAPAGGAEGPSGGDSGGDSGTDAPSSGGSDSGADAPSGGSYDSGSGADAPSGGGKDSGADAPSSGDADAPSGGSDSGADAPSGGADAPSGGAADAPSGGKDDYGGADAPSGGSDSGADSPSA